MWTIALPPLTWATSGQIPDTTFDFLLEDLANERIGCLPLQVIKNLHSMGKDSLLACDSFHTFVLRLDTLVSKLRLSITARLYRHTNSDI